MAQILPVRRVLDVRKSTFAALLAERRRADPAGPLVTFYDDASGERVELSATTYANWVAKTASLAQDELDLERGALVLLDLPTHWLGAVWLGAAWTLGLCVTDEADLLPEAALVVCGPAGVARYREYVDRTAVVALSLRPLGGRFVESLPDGVVDFGAVVLAQPDAFTPLDPPSADDAAWRDGSGVLTQSGLLAEPLAVDLAAGARLITDLNPATRRGLPTLVAPLALGAGAVWLAETAPGRSGPDEARWQALREQERVSAELRA
jgi:uncharacterized protein (TIGR03089 family)